MSNGLDPAQLTPAASLNRVRFVEVPGVALPPEMLDRTAFELFSARALEDLSRTVPDSDILARRFGERLGWLLVTLRRGDPPSRGVRPDWDDSYWQHWAGISTVYLGGGIVSGRLGPGIAEQASRTLAAAGLPDCAVRVAPWPEHLPLIGAARTIPEADAAVVLDFGQSFVKRACAQYQYIDGDLASLRILPRRPARWTDIAHGPGPTSEDVRRLGDFMVETMADTWRAARARTPDLSVTIVASLASYLRNGRPLARQGGAYSTLLALSDNLEAWLSDRVSVALDRPLTVRLLPDATAAAHVWAGEPHAAVIMLGTALGIGFPPAAEPCRPFSPRFMVIAPEPEPA